MGLTNPRTRKLSSPQQGWRIYSFSIISEKKKDKSKVILAWFWTEILYVRTVYTVYSVHCAEYEREAAAQQPLRGPLQLPAQAGGRADSYVSYTDELTLT